MTYFRKWVEKEEDMHRPIVCNVGLRYLSGKFADKSSVTKSF